MSPTIRRSFASIMACGVALLAAGNASAFGERGCYSGCGASCPTCGSCDFGYPMCGMPYQGCGYAYGCGCGNCGYRHQACRNGFGYSFRPFLGYAAGCRSCGYSNCGGCYPTCGYSQCGSCFPSCGYSSCGYGGCGRGCGGSCRGCFGSCQGCGCQYQPSCGGCRSGFGGLFGARRCQMPMCYAYEPFVQPCVPFGYYPTTWSNMSAPCYSGAYTGNEPQLAPDAAAPQYAPAPQYGPVPANPMAQPEPEPLPTPRRLEPGHTALEAPRFIPLQPAGYMPNR